MNASPRAPRALMLLAVSAAWLPLACGDDAPSTLTSTLGADGGELVVAGATLTIPRDALAADTDVTLAQVSQNDVPALPATLSFSGEPFVVTPHGQSFENFMQASLAIPYRGDDADLFVMRLDDADDTTWEVVLGPTFADGVASLSISSFSIYVVARATVTGLDTLSETPHFAVVSGDFSSTAISMLDAAGDPIDDRWFTSGDALTGLVSALGGDVVLPTTQPAGQLTVLDRFRVDVLTRIEIPSGDVVGQLRTHETSTTAGFSSNPHDFIQLDANSAWVTRHNANFDASAPDSERGSDLVEVGPVTWTRTGGRIALDAVDVDGTSVPARPSRIVQLGDLLVVGLVRLSGDFSVSAEGAVAIVDTTDQSVSTLSFGDLRNCGRVVPVPGDDTRVVVACVGHGGATFDPALTRASAGVVVLRADAGVVTEERRWVVASEASNATSVQNLVALSSTLFVAAEWGDFTAGTTDEFFLVDMGLATQTSIFVSSGTFRIGFSAYDSASGLLLVPDADGLRRMDVDGSAVTETDVIQLAPSLGLTPQKAYLL